MGYNEYDAAVSIESLGLMEGKLPPKVLSLVVEWASQHQTELLEKASRLLVRITASSRWSRKKPIMIHISDSECISYRVRVVGCAQKDRAGRMARTTKNRFDFPPLLPSAPLC